MTKFEIVESIEAILNKPTEGLWRASKDTLLTLLAKLEGGK